MTTGLFFEDVLIGQQEAPQRILESQRFQSTYHAVLKKKFGSITADDFLKYARRFAVLCDEVYRESNLRLRKNQGVPLGYAFFAASQGEWEGVPGETLDLINLTADLFQEIFELSSSMVLVIRPKVAEHLLSSFAEIEWTHGRPKTIFFYAQDGYHPDRSHRPLENLLLQKLFYVSGVAPSFNFAVKLGVGAYMDEMEGKL